MSGLFSRLAKQAVSHQRTEVMPAHAPVFSNETGAGIDDVLTSSNSQGEHDEKNVQEHRENHNHTQRQAKQRHSRGPVADKSSFVEQAVAAVSEPLTTQKRAVVGSQSNDSITITHEHENSSIDNKFDEPSVQPQVENSSDVLEPSQTWQTNRQEKGLRKRQQESQPVSVQKATEILPQASRSHSADVRFNINNTQGSTPRPTSAKVNVSEPAETVINVSIGQIEVKASTSEVLATPKARKSNRKPSISLDDYQRQRQRGQR